jgi:hypothetical protein
LGWTKRHVHEFRVRKVGWSCQFWRSTPTRHLLDIVECQCSAVHQLRCDRRIATSTRAPLHIDHTDELRLARHVAATCGTRHLIPGARAAPSPARTRNTSPIALPFHHWLTVSPNFAVRSDRAGPNGYRDQPLQVVRTPDEQHRWVGEERDRPIGKRRLEAHVESASRYEELENVVIASWNVDTGQSSWTGTGAGVRSHERYPEAAFEITDEALHLPLVRTHHDGGSASRRARHPRTLHRPCDFSRAS